MTRNQTSPYPGERYLSTDHKLFTITQLYQYGSDPWVEYTDQKNQVYTCRLEAFQARFSPVTE